MLPGGSIPVYLHMIFQGIFAIITPALIVGGFAERMKFSAMLLFSTIWVIVVYSPICHWVWGGGWLGQMGLQDFAGTGIYSAEYIVATKNFETRALGSSRLPGRLKISAGLGWGRFGTRGSIGSTGTRSR